MGDSTILGEDELRQRNISECNRMLGDSPSFLDPMVEQPKLSLFDTKTRIFDR